MTNVDTSRALKMLEYLQQERRAGRITPEKRITQEALAKIAKDVSQRDIQYWFEWLSREGYGIASTATGCYAILEAKEFDETIHYLRSKALNAIERLKLVCKAKENMMKVEDGLFSNEKTKSIIETLQREFETVKV